MKLFENVGKNGFPVERRVLHEEARAFLQIYKNRKTLAEEGFRKSKVYKGRAKWEKLREEIQGDCQV